MRAAISRVFINGNSQAVRIPQEFRLDCKRVEISQTASGDLLIRPVPEQRGASLLQALTGFDSDFVEQLAAAKQLSDPQQEREAL